MSESASHNLADEMEHDTLAPHSPLDGYYTDEYERRRLVCDFFDSSARSYEWISNFLSLGFGGWYRRDVLRRAGVIEGKRVLDVACGTGAVARNAKRLVGPSGRVIGIDASMGMLREQRRRASVSDGIARGLAEELPIVPCTFDFITMGYALRHVGDLNATFVEYFRILRPGGRLAILEFVRPDTPLTLVAAKLFLAKIVPLAAAIRSRRQRAREMMRYCWDTVERSIEPSAIIGAMSAAGFAQVTHAKEYGLFANYIGTKPVAEASTTRFASHASAR